MGEFVVDPLVSAFIQGTQVFDVGAYVSFFFKEGGDSFLPFAGGIRNQINTYDIW